MNALRSERGSVALGGLTKLVIILAVVGSLAYDGVAIIYGRFQVADHSTLAADAAGETWRQTLDLKKSYQAAQAVLKPTGEVIDSSTFTIDPETDTVKFHVTGTAPTVLAQRWSVTRPLTVVEANVVTKSAAPS